MASIAPSPRRALERDARSSEAGFTLIELMVVVTIVAIFAVLAMPNMGAASVDRHVYEDASHISDMIRGARARAMGRGAAVAIFYDTSSGKGGTFRARESVTLDPVSGSTVARVPFKSCMSPTDWTGSTTSNPYYEYEVLNLDGNYEGTEGISTVVYTGSPGALSSSTKGALCFTPMGRTYLVTGSAPVKGMFDASTPLLGALLLEVAKRNGSTATGIARTVVVPPNGIARINSSSALLK